MARLLMALGTLMLATSGAFAAPLTPHPGDTFEIRRDVEATETMDGMDHSSSTDRDTLMERVVRTTSAGLELEYDLSVQTTPEDRARQWQFPARVLKSPQGSLQLTDRAELDARVKAWLKAAALPETACGHWYFTWNAFQIECDPETVVTTIEGFNLGPDVLVEGAPYKDADAVAPAPLKRKPSTQDGEVFTVEMAVDPDVIRRDRAQSDVVAGEITRRPVTFEAALRSRSAEDISGTIKATFETDETGRPMRQTKVIALKIKSPSDGLVTRTVTETLERRKMSPPKG